MKSANNKIRDPLCQVISRKKAFFPIAPGQAADTYSGWIISGKEQQGAAAGDNMTDQVEKIIRSFDRESLENDLNALVSSRFSGKRLEPPELKHLVAILTNTNLLFTDIYDYAKYINILDSPVCSPLHFIAAKKNPSYLTFIANIPDNIKTLGDKCLFDRSVAGVKTFRNFELEELGRRSYRYASDLLHFLSADKHLRRYYQNNMINRRIIDDEINLLKIYAENFHVHRELIQELVKNRLSQESAGKETGAAGWIPAIPDFLETAEVEPLDTGGEDEPELPDDDFLEIYDDFKAEDLVTEFSKIERTALFSMLDSEKLRRDLKKIVIQQEKAIDEQCDQLCLYSVGTKNPVKPLSFLFTGPTGVGKNYLVETLRDYLTSFWKFEIPYLEIDGPQYTYPSDVNELKGAARGFIRSDEQGILSEFHHKSSLAPLAIILIDEVEKAHPQLRKFFLSVMDRGTTTDNRGKLLDFSNTMLFFTSNIGYSDVRKSSQPIGYKGDDEVSRFETQTAHRELKKAFSPEFINRIHIIHFDYLSRESIGEIFNLEFKRIARRFRVIQDLTLKITKRAKERIISTGYSREYGARNLVREIDRVCNIEVCKKLKTDESEKDASILKLIERIRKAKKAPDMENFMELKEATLREAKVKVDYSDIIVDYGSSGFKYVTARANMAKWVN